MILAVLPVPTALCQACWPLISHGRQLLALKTDTAWLEKLTQRPASRREQVIH